MLRRSNKTNSWDCGVSGLICAQLLTVPCYR